MFDWLHTRARVGLTFTDQMIRLVLYRGNPSDLSHLQFWENELTPDIVQAGKIVDEQAFTDILKDMVHAIGAKGKSVSFAIPETQLVLRKLDMPGLMTDADLKNYFFMEIGKKIQLPFDQPVFAFHTIAQDATGTKVILFASPESIVRHYMKIMRNAGLDPVSAEFASLGIERWLLYQHPDIDKQQRMYIQLEKEALTVTFFDQQVPLFVRQVRLPQVSRPDNASQSDEFFMNASDEVGRMVDFYNYSVQAGETKLEKAYLIGSNETMTAFKKALSPVLDVPISILSIDPELTASPEDLDPAYLPAIGLAMKEVHA
ncbi:MAG: pilus assembly protein PilM [Sporolactobacillus sp.]